MNMQNSQLKSKFKKLIEESINEVKEEIKIDNILKEDFNKDVALFEQHCSELSDMSDRGMLTEAEIDEAFFDTLKNFGKNAISSVTDAWKKAKKQGNKDEMARLEKRLEKLKSQSGSSRSGTSGGGSKSSGGSGKSVGGGSGTKGKPDKQNRPNSSNKKSNSGAARKKVATEAGKNVIKALERQDPKTAKVLKSSSPKKVAAALNNPKVRQKAEEIKKQIATETPVDGGSGFLGKMAAWMKKNPVKGTAAIALLGVVATAAAVGSGGVVPLIGSMVGGAAKGAAIGGLGGGVIKGATALAAGKGLKQAGKDFVSGAKSGAKAGAVGGALGGLLGNALKGAGIGLKNIMAGKPGEVSTSELNNVETKVNNTVENPEDPYADMTDHEIQTFKKFDRIHQGLDAMGIKNGTYRSLGTDKFSITSPEGVTREFSFDKNNKILDAAKDVASRMKSTVVSPDKVQTDF